MTTITVPVVPQPYYAAGHELATCDYAPSRLKFHRHAASGVACPGFWKLDLGSGCSYGCSFCYLQVSLSRGARMASGFGARPRFFTPGRELEAGVRAWLQSPKLRQVLNAGEIADSLLYDDYLGHSAALFPLFEDRDANPCGHDLLYVSRSANVEHLIRMATDLTAKAGHPIEHVILSWSLNPPEIVERYEIGTPSLAERLTAVRRCQDAGYRIRLKIDPIIPVNGWMYSYAELVKAIAAAGITPERWTLAFLRLLPGQRAIPSRSGRGLADLDMTIDETGRAEHKTISRTIRVRAYWHVRDQIQRHYPKPIVAICKESIGVREALGYETEDCLGNCTV